MADLYAYRADDVLAAALRQHKIEDDAFCERVKQFDDANPGHEILWAKRGLTPTPRAVGFTDGHDDVPAGLSRAQTRVELKPKKTKAGKPWQDVLDEMLDRPAIGKVLHDHGVPESAMGGAAPTGGMYVSSTQWADTGETGVIVFNGASLDSAAFGSPDGGRGPHLTPIPLSEFYSIKERLDGEREAKAS